MGKLQIEKPFQSIEKSEEKYEKTDAKGHEIEECT